MDAVRAVVEGQAFILGEPVARFERALAERLGAEHAVGVASCTDAPPRARGARRRAGGRGDHDAADVRGHGGGDRACRCRAGVRRRRGRRVQPLPGARPRSDRILGGAGATSGHPDRPSLRCLRRHDRPRRPGRGPRALADRGRGAGDGRHLGRGGRGDLRRRGVLQLLPQQDPRRMGRWRSAGLPREALSARAAPPATRRRARSRGRDRRQQPPRRSRPRSCP